MTQDLITAEDIIKAKNVQAKPVTLENLGFAIDWLGAYEPNDDDEAVLQAIANLTTFLANEITRRAKITQIAQAKRKYAKQHNIPISQVRIVKNQKG